MRAVPGFPMRGRCRLLHAQPSTSSATHGLVSAPRITIISLTCGYVAEREGFEPPGRLHARLLSRSLHPPALPSVIQVDAGFRSPECALAPLNQARSGMDLARLRPPPDSRRFYRPSPF
jgi:hypothetical protein